MTDRGELLEQLRPIAFAIAYQMLGTISDAEDVVQEALLRVHRALEARALSRPLQGRPRVAGTLSSWLREGMSGLSLRRVEVNGSPGVLLLDTTQRTVCVVALDIAGGEIRGISYIVNPDKLAHTAPLGDYAALLRSAT